MQIRSVVTALACGAALSVVGLAQQGGGAGQQATGQQNTRQHGTAKMHHKKPVVRYGTVTEYNAGQNLTLKMRGREGTHKYDLNNVSANIPSDIAVGSHVKVIEGMTQNGERSLTVEPVTAKTKATRQQRKTGSQSQQPQK